LISIERDVLADMLETVTGGFTPPDGFGPSHDDNRTFEHSI
jgi:hypothetical protein